MLGRAVAPFDLAEEWLTEAGLCRQLDEGQPQ
jgi:hypothetical protein